MQCPRSQANIIRYRIIHKYDNLLGSEPGQTFGIADHGSEERLMPVLQKMKRFNYQTCKKISNLYVGAEESKYWKETSQYTH
jgi:hypothetical protein